MLAPNRHDPDKYHVIKEKPELAIVGDDVRNLRYSTISHIIVGTGRIAVHSGLAKLTEQELRVAILATLGLSNPEIAAKFGVGTETPKTQLSNIYAKFDCPDRTSIARAFFESEVYTVEVRSGSLALSPAELPVIDSLSFGANRREAGTTTVIEEDTVRSHLRRIGARTGWRGQEEIVLAALTAGDIGNFAARDALAQPMEPTQPATE